MCRLLVIASAFDLEGAGPLDELQDQIGFVNGLGVQAELFIDPSQFELELALLSNNFDCSFSPISRCYHGQPDGQVVPRDYDIYAVFEKLDQPFIGSTYFHSLLVEDKTLANDRHGLAPPGILITRALFEHKPSAVLQRLKSLSFPAIIKPNALGGSIAIDSDAIVPTANEAMDRVAAVFGRIHVLQEVRVEKFLDNAREFTVAVLGNGSAVATSVTEVVKLHEEKVYSESEKRAVVSQRRVRYQTVTDGVLRGSLATLSHETFRRFRLRDLARFDVLLADRFYLVDINVPPVLSNSFSHEWQALYGTKKRELLAYALAAFHYRRLAENKPSPVPLDLLRQVPRAVRQALCPLSAIDC
jgi:D-alanine-D-alanine ligase-like ATP-grasp enzyme